ncbi:hypothetical protein [Marinifilum caeruleilacunae]|uniref:Protein SirB1 N-terminal domain-containing protein n=1 Tax=Marinifilum caeruleilacunae TaxID=2499076 RepID=A0ABX1WSL6_9BACT|nr:hypothetical protein [Marinifilum caeruleilacunae]NOU59098.1 hypothetical protein [Marinifilum caeruleilacunae]
METVFKTYHPQRGVVFRTTKGEEIGQGVRPVRSGVEFSHLIDTKTVSFTSSFTEGGVEDTVRIMCEIIKNHHAQVKDLAAFLQKATRFQTLKAIWDFVFNHIQYKNDKKGIEQLSTPARIWLNRVKPNTPSDCDDHSIFIGSLLYCLGIPYTIRIAGYEGKPFSHVYIVSDHVCIDTVLHRFNCEAQYTSKKDTQMQIETLAGYGASPDTVEGLGALQSLHDSAEQYDAEIEVIDSTQELNGIGSALLQQEENALKKMGIAQLSTTLSEYQKEPEKFHALGFGLSYWKHMQSALNALLYGESLEGIIIKLEDGSGWETANLSPLNGIVDQEGNTVGLLGTLEGLFKKLRRKIKKGFKAIKKGVRNVGRWARKKLKKIGKFMMKINPINIAIRAVLRARISKNANNLALKMGYGLLTLAQAEQLGIEKSAWEKSKRAYAKFAKKYRFLGGRESKLRKVLASAWQKTAKKADLPSMSLHGNLGELDGRRRRRRRRRRRAAAERRRRLLLAQQKHTPKKMSRFEKERLAFLKLIHKDIANQVQLKGELGVAPVVAAGASKGILAKAMLILKPILKLLSSLGLGDFITKLKKKRIDNLSKRIENETDPEKKARLIQKKAKAENNLVIFNKEYGKYKGSGSKSPLPSKEHRLPDQNKPFAQSSNSGNAITTSAEFADQKVNKAGMNPFAIGAMVLIGGGLLWSANQDKKDNSKKSK